MKLRKQYYKRVGKYLIIATQHNSYKDDFTVSVKELNEKEKVVNEWLRPKTSPFMDGIKKEMCFFVQSPIDDTIPLSEFEVNEFI